MSLDTRRGVTRRALAAGVAAAAPWVQTRRAGARPRGPHVVVVGAGAFGGWSALQLLRRGARVTLLDAWGPGNSRSSSGGETRVIRSVYGPDRIYSEMVAAAFEDWKALEAQSGEALYRETGSLWMFRGDASYLEAAVPLVEELGFPVRELTVRDAAARFPQVAFGDVEQVFLEQRAGILFARRACRTVVAQFEREGGVYERRLARVEAPLRDSEFRLVAGDDRTLVADHYVLACGPWLKSLLPNVLGETITPTRQEVLYFGTPPATGAFGAEELPVWIDFGDRIFYGVPDLTGRGFKVADDTRGAAVDPSALDRVVSTEGVERARAFLRHRFPELANAPILETRVCQYENSPDGDLVVDRHPGFDNVWIAGGGSGHGFKLGPAVGRRVCGQIVDGLRVEPRFALTRRNDASSGSTQFETDRDP